MYFTDAITGRTLEEFVIAMRERREHLFKSWLHAHNTGCTDNMGGTGFWARRIREFNDAHAEIMRLRIPK